MSTFNITDSDRERLRLSNKERRDIMAGEILADLNVKKYTHQHEYNFHYAVMKLIIVDKLDQMTIALVSEGT